MHEAEAARGRIDSLLQSFEKTWDTLIELLGAGTVIAIDADIAGDIAALGDADLIDAAVSVTVLSICSLVTV